MIEHYDFRKKLEVWALLVIVVIVFTYGTSRVYPLVAGPRIVINEPQDGAYVASTTFEVAGSVTRVREISIQGRAVPINSNGEWREVLIAQKPYTIVIISAEDFYGKKITRTIRVVPR